MTKARHDETAPQSPPRRARALRVRVAAVICLAVGSWLLCMAGLAGSASAATTGGTATITNPVNGEPLASGGSTSTFTVVLPANSACSGDTANDGYHVYSYLVPQGTDLAGVTFVNFPSVGYGFVDNTGTYYGPANTAITTGEIIAIPNDFEWAPLVTSDGGSVSLSQLLYGGASGVWEAGLACADTSGKLTDSWNTEVTFSASSGDPNGFDWTAVPGSGTSTSTTTTTSGAPTSSTTPTSTTTPGGSTSTTLPGSSTTTTISSTSTSGSTTTSTSIDGTSTTSPTDSTTTADESGSTGSSIDGLVPSTDSADGSSAGGAPVEGSGLARTGAPLTRFLALGLLCIGLGLVMLGLEARWQQAGTGPTSPQS